MNTDMKRRVFLQGSLAAGTVGVAVGAGLLAPQAVVAAWPEKAFKAENVADATKAALGAAEATESADITIKAPDIAENGAVVPITIKTSIPNVESISLMASSNGQPLAGMFVLGDGAVADVSTRIKMGKTGDVIALVKADGKLYSNQKNVKVTIGGCGG